MTTQSTHGGKRPNTGPKPKPPELKQRPRSVCLTDAEWAELQRRGDGNPGLAVRTWLAEPK